MKPFLNFIWDLEKNETQASKTEIELINDIDLPVEEKGEIYKILTKQAETPRAIIDEGSQSLRNHNRAIEEMASEGRN